jgi:hypothetical protein
MVLFKFKMNRSTTSNKTLSTLKSQIKASSKGILRKTPKNPRLTKRLVEKLSQINSDRLVSIPFVSSNVARTLRNAGKPRTNLVLKGYTKTDTLNKKKTVQWKKQGNSKAKCDSSRNRWNK